MEIEIFNKWVAALKYGRHVIPAAYGELKTVMRCPGCYRYSAAGILCHVAATDGIIQETPQGFAGPAANGYHGMVWNHHEQMPGVFIKWTGLQDEAGLLAPIMLKMVDKAVTDRKLTLPDFGRLLGQEEGIYGIVASVKQA